MPSNNLMPVDPNTDPYGYVGLVKNPDGSIKRSTDIFPIIPASSDIANPIQVLTRDICINQQNKTWARVYLRRSELVATPKTKLPLIVYFHGGGFVTGSAASSIFHNFCVDFSKEFPVITVSVEYRLGPEYRLPAAYDDCFEALHWIKTTDEEWLTTYADFSRCLLFGSSAGGNIVYHLALRLVKCGVEQLMPLKIQGLILHCPFFGGTKRTPTEIRLHNDEVLPLCLTDIMWDLALPIGVERDHEYSNPMTDIKVELLEKVKEEGWKLVVIGSYGDPMVDRQIEFVKMLKEKDVQVIEKFSEGGSHGLEILDISKARSFYDAIKNLLFTL